LKPDSGKVLVDGCNIHENLKLWQQHIGYIPQNIYLSDNTICRNIAFGLDDTEIDEDKVWAAIKNAQLEEVVMALPEGLDTRIGEHGLRMSGGQRQRIGIARALYNDPEVLVMDEATSSLDAETEREISNAIDRLSGQKTLLIIAHRMTTVEKCDMRFYIRNGKIEKILMKEKKEVG
jgi:ABC-type multidrug transport system fused ATPase/permease subunit